MAWRDKMPTQTTSLHVGVICTSCQTVTPREDFQRKLEDMNPEAASAMKRMVEAEQLLKQRRGPLHPSTEEEIMRAAEVRQAGKPHPIRTGLRAAVQGGEAGPGGGGQC